MPDLAQPDRRQEILRAALESFIAQGVAGASIADIQRRCGASIGSIYHHFLSKDAIAGAVYLDGLADHQDGFLAALARAGSTRAAVESGVRHHLAWVRRRPGLARFLLLGRDASVIVAGEEPLVRQNQRFHAALADWAQPRLARHELRDLPVELMSAVWLGPSQEFARGWLTSPSRPAMVTAEAALPAAAWRGLRGPGVQVGRSRRASSSA